MDPPHNERNSCKQTEQNLAKNATFTKELGCIKYQLDFCRQLHLLC